MKIPAMALAAALGACAAPAGPESYRPAASEGASTFDPSGSRAPSPQTLESMARVLAAQGRDEECERVLEGILQDFPEHVPAYDLLAALHVRRNRLDPAEEVLLRGLEKAPGDPVLLNNLGMCDLLRGHPERAAGRFVEAAARVPHDARTRANLAAALGMQGRFDEALALYLQVLPPADAHWNVGVLAEARKDAGRASREFGRADALRKDRPRG